CRGCDVLGLNCKCRSAASRRAFAFQGFCCSQAPCVQIASIPVARSEMRVLRGSWWRLNADMLESSNRGSTAKYRRAQQFLGEFHLRLAREKRANFQGTLIRALAASRAG